MSWVAAAIIGSTVVSGIASSRASSKAAKAGERGLERSAAAIEASANRAREDVFDFFPSAQKDLLAGAGAAGDILTQGIGEQQRLLSAGNVGAQSTLGAGFNQQQNALLGLPVNQQSFAPREIPLSQPLQNPLATGAGGQQSSGQGLFSNIASVPVQADRSRFESAGTNAEVLNQVLSGEINLPGVDTSIIDLLLRSGNFSAGGSLTLDRIASLSSPEAIDAYVKRTIPNLPELQAQLKTLVTGLSGIVNV